VQEGEDVHPDAMAEGMGDRICGGT
jgi:hypothetical protein